MKKGKMGFTLIEVAIFLAVTGALFISVTIGVQNSISQQRFNDSVQNFAEFLRSIYSEVSNVQNIKAGVEEKAIYGKLVTFGENINPGDDPTEENQNTVYSYDVIGNIGDLGTGNTLKILSDLNANIVIKEGDILKPAGLIESYTPKWVAEIEPACGKYECLYTPFIGALLIVRHPNSGTIYTYVMDGKTIKANSSIKDSISAYETAKTSEADAKTPEEKATFQELLNSTYDSILKPYLESSGGFEIKQIDFCINPRPGEDYLARRDIRIREAARNASGVEVVNDDDSKCVRKN